CRLSSWSLALGSMALAVSLGLSGSVFRFLLGGSGPPGFRFSFLPPVPPSLRVSVVPAVVPVLRASVPPWSRPTCLPPCLSASVVPSVVPAPCDSVSPWSRPYRRCAPYLRGSVRPLFVLGLRGNPVRGITTDMQVRFEGVSKRFGAHTALAGLDPDIAAG